MQIFCRFSVILVLCLSVWFVGCAPSVQREDPPVVMEYATVPFYLGMGPAQLERILDGMAQRGWSFREFIYIPTREAVFIIWEKPCEQKDLAPPEDDVTPELKDLQQGAWFQWLQP